ncbi:MAG: cation diffusion facilitator family transporter [Thermoplasmata archaeon]
MECECDLPACSIRNKAISGKLIAAMFVTVTIALIEIIGGFLTNSLALLSDSAHVFGDVFALLISFAAIELSKRPANIKNTFGFHRIEIFASMINGLSLVFIAFLIFYHAYERLLTPPEIKSLEMLVIAVIGLVGNIFVSFRLSGHHDLNVKGAYLHVLGDTLSSFAVIVGGIVMFFTGNHILDPILSVFIGVILLIGSFRLMRDATSILMESTPKHIKTEELIDGVKKINGVQGMHDIHIWSICSNVHALSAHIFVDEMHLSKTPLIIDDINKFLKSKYRIAYTTLQFECIDCGKCEVHDINSSMEEEHSHEGNSKHIHNEK